MEEEQKAPGQSIQTQDTYMENFMKKANVYPGTQEIKDKYTYRSLGDQIQAALQSKQEGNEYFKQKEYKQAQKHYLKVLLLVKAFQTKDSQYFQYDKTSQQLSEEEQNKIQELKQTTYLNISQIDLYNKDYKKAIERANKSLEIKESAKAYYRRGTAYLELDDLNQAEQDFNKVKKLDPQTNIDTAMQKIKQKQQLIDKQLSKKMKGLFSQ